MTEKKAVVKVEEQANELVKVKVDNKTIEDFLFTSGTKLDEKQEALFLQLALRNQLDPFKREIYAITYKNKNTGKNDLSIVTGYQVYIQRAETTGKLNGWHCEVIKDAQGVLTGATITIHRKDFEHPFEWEVSLKEFTKGQANWQQMPEFMIKKVCIGQGFRLAFPSELGGLPYLQEEIEEAIPIQVGEEKTKEIKPEVTPSAPTVMKPPIIPPTTVKKPASPLATPLSSLSATPKKTLTPKEYMEFLLKTIKETNTEFYNNVINGLVEKYGDKFPDNLANDNYSEIVTRLKPYVRVK